MNKTNIIYVGGKRKKEKKDQKRESTVLYVLSYISTFVLLLYCLFLEILLIFNKFLINFHS